MLMNAEATVHFQKSSLFMITFATLLLNVYQKMATMQSTPQTDISNALLRSMIKYFGR